MSSAPITLIVHGGAWAIPAGSKARSQEGVEKAVAEGFALLAAGSSALDAVEKAVMSLENNPIFDAGTGSTLNSLGEVVSLTLILPKFALESWPYS